MLRLVAAQYYFSFFYFTSRCGKAILGCKASTVNF